MLARIGVARDKQLVRCQLRRAIDAERRDRVVGKDELLALVWPGLVVEENNLQVQISGLRRVLGAGAIATVAGVGYRFTLAEVTMPVLAEEDLVLVDWLPWNHTFGGNHNVGLTVYNGGTLYIDDGKPVPALIGETLRNLREIAPTVYFNVPKGLEEIASAMDSDRQLRDTLFKRCKAFMFAGAALSQSVWDKLHSHAEASVGERVRAVYVGLEAPENADAFDEVILGKAGEVLPTLFAVE